MLIDIALVDPVYLFEIIKHIGYLGRQVGTGTRQDESRHGTGITHMLVIGRIDIAEALGPHDDVHIGNHRAVDIPHHAAHNVRLLLVGEADHLPHRVERAENLAGERLGKHHVVARGEHLFAVAVQKLIIENPEEGRIGMEYRGEELLPALLVADDINAVGLGVVVVARKLPKGVVGDQDHEHQRDGQPEDIDGRIELVAPQEVEKRAEIELTEHIIRF